MRRRLFVPAAFISCSVLACAESKSDRDASALADTSVPAQSGGRLIGRCYRSSHSVLLGPITKSRQNGQGPGWIRFDGPSTAVSGSGELVDASRAGLGATWSRGPGDSLSVMAADDFLRVELRLVVSDRTARGSALATSDADVERDSFSGRLRDFRRGWILSASRAPCDSMPVRGPQPPATPR